MTAGATTNTRIARIYCRVFTEEQDLSRQLELKNWAQERGFYVAKVYAEKVGGRTSDRPKLKEMIDNLQNGETVIIENIDRLSRLSLHEAENLVTRISDKEAKLLFPNVGMPENQYPDGTLEAILLKSFQDIILAMILKSASDDYELRRQRQAEGFKRAKEAGKKIGGRPIPQQRINDVMKWRNMGMSIAQTAKATGCSQATVKRITRMVKDGIYQILIEKKK